MAGKVVERKPISKKLRFEIFKRDSFACQYCGATPPAAILEIDHIHPVSKGGENSTDNLITACFDCNRGKSSGLLASIPPSLSDKADLMAEKLEQIKAYEKLIKAKRRSEEKSIDQVEDVFKTHFPGFSFSAKFRGSVRVFLQKLTVYEVMDAMDRACSKIQRRDDSVRYFCGICWKTIKEQKNG